MYSSDTFGRIFWIDEDLEFNDILKENPLWLFQERAVEAWKKNKQIWLLEMATGTGKTYTAIHALIQTQRENDSLLTILVCHSKDLCKQWAKEFKKFGLEAER